MADEEDTRAIARKAVEDEFRKKKKRRKHGGYDSSDDDDEKAAKRHKKAKAHEKSSSAENTKPKKASRPVAIWEVKYRDRAKERREGKEILDHDDDDDDNDEGKSPTKDLQQSLLDDVLEDEGQANEPVKGLDRRLIQKEHFHENQESSLSKFVSNRQEALEWISKAIHSSSRTAADAAAEPMVTSTLGKDLLAFLQNEYLATTAPPSEFKEPTPAGLAIQRSTLIFSTAPGKNIHHAWEIPRQEIVAATAADTTGNIPKISPINDESLLERMKILLDHQRDLEQKNTASNQSQTKEQEPQKPAFDDDDDEDIFQISDEDDNDDKKEPSNPNATQGTKLAPESLVAKSRRTFFFQKPPEQQQQQEGPAPSSDSNNNYNPAIPQKLERLSEMERDDDIVDDFDGGEDDGKKKKKRKRKKKNGDDSD